jgi:N-carbamoyl-L-amino-acid hydrolase
MVAPNANPDANPNANLGANLTLNGDRLWDSLMEMAKIGPGIAGGNNRQTLTDEDAEGRRLFAKWCEAEGLTMGIDQMGTMFARREGTEIKTRHPIVVTNWTNEEGTRFAPAMLASGVFAGVLDQSWAYDREDAAGLKFGDELDRIGFKGPEPVGNRPMKAFFELHIEQGPILEAEGKDIGVVTHGQGLRWIEITVTGKESHTGSTPMAMRRNAGRGLAQITELVHEIAMKHQPNAVGAIGHVDIYPNSRNIIPGRAVFTVDFRSHVLETLEAMVAELLEKAPEVCEALGVGFESEIVGQFDPPAFDEGCVRAVRDAAERLGYSHMNIVSGAGHDACWINRVYPTSMVMCPCVDGLSHNEAEEISPEWAEKGANVLFHAVVETAEIVE